MIVYASFVEAASVLNDEDRLSFFDAMFGYGIYGIEPKLTGMAKALFAMAKPQIKANNERYENGKKGGRPKKTSGFQEVKPLDTETENHTFDFQKPNVNVNENVNENGNVVYLLPLKDGTEYAVTDLELSEWKNAYPGKDVDKEFLRMIAWLKSNERKQKTRKGVKRFINGWLARDSKDSGYEEIKPQYKPTDWDRILGGSA